MHLNPRRLAATLVTAAVLVVTIGGAPPASAAGRDSLQGLMDELVAAGTTGVVATVDDGTSVRRLASGVAQRGDAQPLRPAARFRAGSTTKTFVATVALQLVAEGRLRLTDTVERWLPGLVPGGDRITLEQLLGHTSGVFDYSTDAGFLRDLAAQPQAYRSPRSLVGVATAHPPLFPPGQGWSYSNTNYVLVGLVEQQATGRSVQQLLTERLIAPLHLRGTSFPGGTWRVPGYLAHGYFPPAASGGAGWLDVTAINASWAWAAGALVSTTEDLERFMSALLSGRLLPPAQLRQMQTTVPVAATLAYGLGLFSLRTACGTVWGHDGAVPGYQTVAYTDPAGRRAVSVAYTTAPTARTGPLAELVVGRAVCEMLGLPASAAPVGRAQVSAGGPWQVR